MRLYRGALLEGCSDRVPAPKAWVAAFQERQARGQAYLAALERLASQALECSDGVSAEGYLRRAVAVDPLRESAQRGLMQALAATGNDAVVTEVYRELRLRLLPHRELNAEPAAEMRSLYQQIRAEARLPAKPSLPVATPDWVAPARPVRC